MVVMRDKWTDERLDDLNDRVGEGFRRIDEQFARVDERFARVDERLAQVDARIDSVQRTMFQGAIALAGIQITGFVGLAGLILAQG